jgi:hypothetical protein
MFEAFFKTEISLLLKIICKTLCENRNENETQTLREKQNEKKTKTKPKLCVPTALILFRLRRQVFFFFKIYVEAIPAKQFCV